MYKAVINTNKSFRFNPENYYTHIDLERAKYELNIDNQSNFLHYLRDKLMGGTELFEAFITTMFDFNLRKLTRSKNILNILKPNGIY